MNHRVKETAALKSLTATYTDSEGEPENESPEASNIDTQPPSNQNSYNSESASDSSTDQSPGSLSKYNLEDLDDDDFHVETSSERYSSSRSRKKPTGLVSYNLEGAEDSESSDDNRRNDSLDKHSLDGRNVVNDTLPESPMSYHRSVFGLDSNTLPLPAEPVGRCSKSLQEKITKLYDKKLRDGKDMNATIQKRKDFRNPSIYEKLIAYLGIDELGTNYPPELYDPHSWGTESFYEELAKRQKEEMEKREKEKKERTKVEFLSGTVKKTTDSADLAKRKTKWDTASGSQAGASVTGVKSAPSAVPTITVPTAISAFAMLSKQLK